MSFHCPLEHLGHGPVHLLVHVHIQQQPQVPEGSPGIPTQCVVEEVEGVVAPSQEVREESQAGKGDRGEQLQQPAATEQGVEAQTGVHGDRAGDPGDGPLLTETHLAGVLKGGFVPTEVTYESNKWDTRLTIARQQPVCWGYTLPGRGCEEISGYIRIYGSDSDIKFHFDTFIFKIK